MHITSSFNILVYQPIQEQFIFDLIMMRHLENNTIYVISIIF